MQLRPYQQAALEAIYRHLRERDDNPVVVIATAGGKTPLLATLCRDVTERWNGRVLVVSHVRELLEQAVDKLKQVAPNLPVGVYSAGLRRRDTERRVIVAGIQSIYRRACELDAFDLIVVDECFPPGTPVSTPRGTVAIEALRPGDVVETAVGPGRVQAVRARFVSELVHVEDSDGNTISCTPSHRFFTGSGWTEAAALEVGEILFSRENVHALRCGVSALEKTSSQWQSIGLPREVVGKAKILLDLLLEEACQPHEPECRATEGSSKTQGDSTPADPPRRERPNPHTAATGTVACPRGRLGGRVRCADGHAQGLGFPDQLQAGPGQSPIEAGNRTRWPQSRPYRPCETGCEEGQPAAFARVVGVSREQCTSPRTVFNLHIDRHPSYFAHGRLVHNCHLIPSDGDGMYRQFLADARVVNPQVRVIGLTATPFRLDSGTICSPDHFLNSICYEIGVKELIRDGFLCPLVSKSGSAKADLSGLHVRGGDFLADEVEQAMDQDGLVEAACREIVAYTGDRRACLIFASGVKHGQHVVQVLGDQHGIECGFVCGETPSGERAELLARFRGELQDGLLRREPLKYLCNVNVLTTGFDAPNIDCVVLLRPTMSPGLFYQQVGRGFRLSPGKRDCLVLDFAGNVLRHGPVDQIKARTHVGADGEGAAPAKECPECRSVIAAAYSTCPDCGHAFPPPARQRHEASASEAGVLSGQVTTTRHKVHAVYFSVHVKRDASAGTPRTMRVDYKVGWNEYKSEWVCFEHTGYARQKAVAWWRRRSPDPVPDTIEQAVDLAESGALAPTHAITVRNVAGEPYERIVDYELGEMPAPVPHEAMGSYEESAVPF